MTDGNRKRERARCARVLPLLVSLLVCATLARSRYVYQPMNCTTGTSKSYSGLIPRRMNNGTKERACPCKPGHKCLGSRLVCTAQHNTAPALRDPGCPRPFRPLALSWTLRNRTWGTKRRHGGSNKHAHTFSTLVQRTVGSSSAEAGEGGSTPDKKAGKIRYAKRIVMSLTSSKILASHLSRSVFPAGWREISDRELSPFSGVGGKGT